ncbi:hypothetical protein MCOR17_005307 [Pyricularia oryzae]|nr:hypothetical protein MCOR17_005307 [Pyricularia oryzae]
MSCLHTTTARSSTDIPGQRPRSIPSNDIDRDEAVPGTVRLVDVSGGTSDAHDKSQADIVLVSQPSADPNDPLNWTHARKLRTYSVLADITADTGISTANLVQGTRLMFLFFGWACLIWQPIALTYGRCGVYLLTMLLTVAVMEWTARSSSASEWMSHRILIGIIVSPIESLCEVTVFDLFFAHNRGTHMGLYVFTLFGSNFLAPLVAGWFNDAYGWRWTMHLGSIACGVCFVVMFLFMEETIYFRSEELPSEQSSVSDMKKEGNTTTTEGPEIQIEYPDINAGWHKYTLFKALPGRPSNGDMLRMVYRPIIRVFRLPTVAWSGFLYGISLSWYNVLNGIREPEHRLWVLLLAGVMSSAGPITWGVGAHYSVHWVGLDFGLGMLTFGVVTGGSIAVS